MIKRIIVAILSVAALSTVIGLPALALGDRFGSERQRANQCFGSGIFLSLLTYLNGERLLPLELSQALVSFTSITSLHF